VANVFFLIGSPRSATTAYARILNTATNAEVHVEQAPKLRRASRDLFKGTLENPEEVLLAARSEAIQAVHSRGHIYGDKNPCYLPFLPYLFRLWESKVVLLTRDPRPVIRSMLDCFELRPVNVFSMQEDDDQSLARTPDDDPWDYSRLRPNPGQPMYERWKQTTRFEKCAWYWATFNALALDMLAAVDRERWRIVDVTNSTLEQVESVFDFLELEGFDRAQVSRMLESKINSLEELTGSCNLFPEYKDWTEEEKRIFARHAIPVMQRLGYAI
jgi:hypothetical protein